MVKFLEQTKCENILKLSKVFLVCVENLKRKKFKNTKYERKKYLSKN